MVASGLSGLILGGERLGVVLVQLDDRLPVLGLGLETLGATSDVLQLSQRVDLGR